MNVLIFGATGMVGQGVLRECLLDDRVSASDRGGRGHRSAVTHPKLRELVHRDFMTSQRSRRIQLPVDACFFCLGVSSAGMSEDE